MLIIKIGKENSNDICFDSDPTVSRFHCQIFVDDDGNKFLTVRFPPHFTHFK